MELATTHCVLLQNPLLKPPRVRVSHKSLSLTPNSISPIDHRQLLRMNISKPISCAASAEDNGSTTTASPISLVARIGEVKRVTKETNVSVKINLDGTGVADNNTGISFLDHMLDQLASHGLFDVHVMAIGDIHIDDHHTNEDVALAIGTAFLQALGDRKGINRFGDFSAPLDEALIHVALDLSGRPYLGYDLQIPTHRVGTYDTQLVEHFFQSLVNTSGMTLHIRQLSGRNSHHIIEATFKAFARALRQATEYDLRRGGTVPRLMIPHVWFDYQSKLHHVETKQYTDLEATTGGMDVQQRNYKIAVLEEQKNEDAENEAAEKVDDDDDKQIDIDPNASEPTTKVEVLDEKPDISDVPMEENQDNNQLVRQDLNERTLDLSLGLKAHDDDRDPDSKTD